jgi:hypothetical protein
MSVESGRLKSSAKLPGALVEGATEYVAVPEAVYAGTPAFTDAGATV